MFESTLVASSKISVKQIQWNKGNQAKQGRLFYVLLSLAIKRK